MARAKSTLTLEDRRRIAKRDWARREQADPEKRAARRTYERERRKKKPWHPHRYTVAAYRAAVVDFLVKRDGLVCGICGDSLEGATKLHINHIHPAALGGADILENFNLTHAYCNISMGQAVRAEKAKGKVT